jgi:hypothetical protein
MPFLQRIFADLFGLLTFQHSGVPHWHDQGDEACPRNFALADRPKHAAARCDATRLHQGEISTVSSGNEDAQTHHLAKATATQTIEGDKVGFATRPSAASISSGWWASG